jgi:hypothetical protein
MSITEPAIINKLLFLCYGAEYKSSESLKRAKKILLHLKEKEAYSKETAISSEELIRAVGLDPSKVHHRTMFSRAIAPFRGHEVEGKDTYKGSNLLGLCLIRGERKDKISHFWLSADSWKTTIADLNKQALAFFRG